jgi:hypothetical protein
MQTLRYRQSNPTTETTITLQIKNHRFSPVVFTHLPNTILSNMNLVLDTKSIVHHTDLKSTTRTSHSRRKTTTGCTTPTP